MKVQLGDLCEINSSSITSKDNPPFINYLDTGNITRNKIDTIKWLDVRKDKIPSRAKRVVKEFDIIYSTVRPVQEHFGIIVNPIENLIVSTGFAVLRVNTEIADPFYVFYFLTQNKITTQLQQIAESSTTSYPSIKPEDIASISIELPSLDVQKKIGRALWAFDRKNQLNFEMIDHLEKLTQLSYERWFVDFNFPDKKGCPYKSSGGVMSISELGLIPNGWTVKSLDELSEIITKGTTPTTLGKKFVDSGVKFIKAESIVEHSLIDYNKIQFIDEDTNKIMKRSELKPDDILFSIAGTLGRYYLVQEDILPANTNQAIAIIRLNKINPLYIYCSFLSGIQNKYFKGFSQQSVQDNINLQNLGNYKLVVPPQEILDNYLKLISPVINKMKLAGRENLDLKNTFDLILTRLMSGKINLD